MTDKYSEYLLSDPWKGRRIKALHIANHQCAACSSSESLQVHHLTYERLFNENQDDLMVLCELCHASIEFYKIKGKVPRNGAPKELRIQTLKLIGRNIPKPKPVVKQVSQKRAGITAKDLRKDLMMRSDFVALLKLNRQSFKKQMRHMFRNHPNRNSVMSNAIICFDSRVRQPQQVQHTPKQKKETMFEMCRRMERERGENSEMHHEMARKAFLEKQKAA